MGICVLNRHALAIALVAIVPAFIIVLDRRSLNIVLPAIRSAFIAFLSGIPLSNALLRIVLFRLAALLDGNFLTITLLYIIPFRAVTSMALLDIALLLVSSAIALLGRYFLAIVLLSIAPIAFLDGCLPVPGAAFRSIISAVALLDSSFLDIALLAIGAVAFLTGRPVSGAAFRSIISAVALLDSSFLDIALLAIGTVAFLAGCLLAIALFAISAVAFLTGCLPIVSGIPGLRNFRLPPGRSLHPLLIYLLLHGGKILVLHFQLQSLHHIFSIAKVRNYLVAFFHTLGGHLRTVIEICQFVSPFFPVVLLLQLFQNSNALFQPHILRRIDLVLQNIAPRVLWGRLDKLLVAAQSPHQIPGFNTQFTERIENDSSPWSSVIGKEKHILGVFVTPVYLVQVTDGAEHGDTLHPPPVNAIRNVRSQAVFPISDQFLYLIRFYFIFIFIQSNSLPVQVKTMGNTPT